YLAGGDHLAGLGIDAGDDPGNIGPQVLEARTVARACEPCGGLGRARAGGVGRRLLAVELALADIALRPQFTDAIEFAIGQRELGARSLQHGARRVDRRPDVLRVERGETLPRCHPIADRDLALGDLAADPEPVANFDPR